MPLKEKISNVSEMRSWQDKIPLHYRYTAGLAGERFFRGLQEGKLVAAECRSCGKKFLPPKVYCVDCFVQLDRFVEVGPQGEVAAVTESHVAFDGSKLEKQERFGYITFRGVSGGLVHRLAKGATVGSRVVARFRPRRERVGSYADLEGFVPT